MQTMTTWWDRNVGLNPNWGHSSLHPQYQWLASFIKPNQRILEVGYGTGHSYAALPTSVTYRGYDITTTFQSICLSRYPNADFRIASVTQLPEPDSSWDIVFSRHLLEHIPDWKLALSEMARVACQSVVILPWRRLSKRPTYSTNTDICAWVFNGIEFLGYAILFGEVVTYEHSSACPIYVIHKEI